MTKNAVRASAGVVGALAAIAAAPAPAAAGDQPSSSHDERFQFCMVESGPRCRERFVAGDLPYARFQDLSGRRTRVRVCVRDRQGRRCWRSKRPAKRYGFVTQRILYRTTGRHLTTWTVGGKVVGRWRWRVVPELE
jgi:hypothetical protein